MQGQIASLGALAVLQSEVNSWPVAHFGLWAIGYGGEPPGRVVKLGEMKAQFWLASLSKPISALAVLVGFEEGLFALDDPVSPLEISWRELLCHASGLAYDHAGAVGIADLELHFGSDSVRRSGYFIRGPRQRRIYSNLGFEVLAHALSSEANMPFHQYVREAVLEPLEMRSTTIEPDRLEQAGPSGAAAGVASTVEDMAKFTEALIAPKLISAATIAEATTNQIGILPGILPGYGVQENNAWGLGFEIRDSKQPHWSAPSNSGETFGHFGRSGTFLWIDPIAQVALCFLGDRPFDDFAKSAWPRLSETVLNYLVN